ncbi:hypothetical protein LJK87_28845 [Paenibacillus sp. P25]|nr:hypothetical protein LJK87_28845 [Paenibacillus sp. P25]
MLSALNKKEEISQRYTEAIHALCGIAGTYHALGRSSDARRVMHHGLQLAETKEAGTEDRLKPLLQYGRILTIEYVYTNSDADLMFAILQEARQIAEAAPHRQGLADALSLLGQGHYFAVLNAGPAADSSQGEYDEALACQQAGFGACGKRCTIRGASANLIFSSVRSMNGGGSMTWHWKVIRRLSKSPTATATCTRNASLPAILPTMH